MKWKQLHIDEVKHLIKLGVARDYVYVSSTVFNITETNYYIYFSKLGVLFYGK